MSRGASAAVIAAALAVSAGLAVLVARVLAPAAPAPAATLAVSSVVPATGVSDGPARGVTVSGTGIVPGARVTLERPGETPVAGTDFAFIDGALVGGTFPLAGVAAGSWSVTVTNPDGGSATCSGCYAVEVPGEAPAVAAISVPEIRQGSAAAVRLTGARFQAGASVAISGAGVRVEEARVISSTTVELRLAADPSAAAGPRAVTLTNPDRRSGACQACLRVIPGPPAPAAAAPSTIGAGAKGRTIAVSGEGFQEGATLGFSHPGIVASGTAVADGGLTASVAVASSTPAGSYDLVVTNRDGQKGTCARCLAVVAAPTALRVAPTAAAPGEVVDLLVTGSGFQQGTALAFAGGGITLGVPTYVSPTQMTVSAVVAATASSSPRTLTLTNPDGGSSTLAKAFAVTAAAPTSTAATSSAPAP